MLPRSAEIQPLFLRFVTLSWRGTGPGWAGWGWLGPRALGPACTQVQVGAGIGGLGRPTALLRSMQPTVPSHRWQGWHTCSTPAAHPGPPGRSPGRRQAMVGPPQTVQGGLLCSSGLGACACACLVGAGLPAHPGPSSDLSGRWAVLGGSGRRPACPSVESADQPALINRICRPACPSVEFCRPASSDQPNLPTSQL